MEGRLAALLPSLALLGLLAISSLPAALAFGAGAPNSPRICESLEPGHHKSFQAGPNQFVVESEQSGAPRGQPVNITITSRHGFPFKGFMMQARTADTQETIGTFRVANESTTKTIDCFNQRANTVTHTSPILKNSTSFEWTPPADFNGPVIFNTTVVQDYDTYWSIATRVLVGDPALSGSTAGISTTREPVTTRRTSTTSAPITNTPIKSVSLQSPIYDGCGSTKACFGIPDKCKSSKDCKAIVSILSRGAKYEFELLSTGGQYVAVGLSDDSNMGGDSVMECVVSEDNNVRLFQSWNVGRKNNRLPTNNGLELKNSLYLDNSIYCKFERDKLTTVNGVTYDLENTKYFLLLARGNSASESGVGYHSDRSASGNSGYLHDVDAFDTAASKLLFRLHGAFMIASWIGAASIGIVLARYFKQTWTGSQMCGKDQWFAWHRMLMVLVWSLTIAAFVIIFVQLKGWSYANGSTSISAHAILGIITTALAFFQPIGALFRPSPDSRRRPIFNWLHWCFGNSAHILGIVTIFLAGELNTAELPKWWIWVMVGYVAFHVLMHLVFSVAGCVSERQGGTRINPMKEFPMKEMSNSRSPLASAERKQEAPHACFRKFLLAVYIIGILGLTIALIVIAVLAPIEENFKRIQKLISSNSSE